MPNRFLKESVRVSDSIDALSCEAERFFYRLLTFADDFGRFDARPSVIRGALFSLKLDTIGDADIASWLEELIAAEIVQLYGAADAKSAHFGQFTNWEKHQGKPRAKASKCPEPAVFFDHLGEDAQRLQADDRRCDQTQANVPVSVFVSGSRSSTHDRARPREVGVCVDEEGFGYVAVDAERPEEPLHLPPAVRSLESGWFERFWARFQEINPRCGSYDRAKHAFEVHVAPGKGAQVMVAVEYWALSDRVKRGILSNADTWLESWQQWRTAEVLQEKPQTALSRNTAPNYLVHDLAHLREQREREAATA